MRQNILYFVYNRGLDTMIFCPFEFEFWRIAAMHNTKDITAFYPLKEINTEIKQLLIPVGFGEYHTLFLSPLFQWIRRFHPLLGVRLLGFIIDLLNAKCSSVTCLAAIFKPQGWGGIIAPPGLRQKSRFVGLLISQWGQRSLAHSAQSAQTERDQNKVNGKSTCLLPSGGISSGQVDKVLTYKGDDEERRTSRH